MKKLRLGDLTEKAIEKIVPNILLEALKDECGCQSRKEQLNYFHTSLIKINTQMQIAINKSLLDLTGEKLKFSRCATCIKDRLNKLRGILLKIEEEQTINLKDNE